MTTKRKPKRGPHMPEAFRPTGWPASYAPQAWCLGYSERAVETQTGMFYSGKSAKEFATWLRRAAAWVEAGTAKCTETRQLREERLRALGYEEPSDQERRERLASNIAARDWPRPPADLVDAKQDRVCRDSGRVRAAKSVRVKQ